MDPIRVVSGTGRGPTELAAYDAALVEAGVGEYNLVELSSVIPAGADVRVVDDPGDLGATGDRLTVVEAAATATEPVGAALAWARAEDGRGVFYETSATGLDPAERAREEAREGVAAGVELRAWTAARRDVVSERARPAPADDDPGRFAAAVVVAAYGDGEAIL